MRQSIIILLILISSGFNLQAKVLKPKLNKYKQFIDNDGFASLVSPRQQVYRLIFVSPKLKEAALAYSKSELKRITDKQKKKYANKPKRLQKELTEPRYTPLVEQNWDSYEGQVSVIAMPSFRREREAFNKYLYQRIFNDKPVTGITIVNKAGESVCKAKHTRLIPTSDFRYIAQVYSSDEYYDSHAGLINVEYDTNLPGYLASFDYKCLLKDGIKVLVENKGAKPASEKIKAKLKKQIERDFGKRLILI